MATGIGQRLRDRAARLTEPRGTARSTRHRRGSLAAVFVAATALVVGGSIQPAQGLVLPAAVLPVLPASTQFDFTGFLQTATVDTPNDPHSGGVVTINGKSIVIPRETIVILPAAALTWQELFSHAPAPYAGTGQSGLALGDNPKPLTTYEFNVIGNRVFDANGTNGCATPGGCDRYIAGLVHVSQQDLNSTAGYINFIDYTTGAVEVGGTLGAQGTGTRVRINDPANPTSGSGGRFGRAFSPDDRFQVDQDNPTISAETGFPMCVPRTDPAVADDALCPQANRPVISSPVVDTSGISPQPNTLVAGEFYKVYRMDNPANIDNNPGLCQRTPCADPRKQAPLEVGDYVTVAGNLTTDANGQYVLAHTIVDSLGVYTLPGVDPSYVSIEVSLIGTGGLTVFGAGEAAARTRFEGMATDETRAIRLYGVDINADGTTTDRDWGSILPDLGPPTGAVRGRWRFRPPCTVQVPTQKACVGPASGQFIPPTREVRAVVTGHSQFIPGGTTPNPASQVPGTPGATTAANGIFWGQYHAPIGEYIFPENVPGTPIPENNFNTIPFLAVGGYSSGTGVVAAGPLNPWPSNVIPAAAVCATPSIIGGPYSLASGTSIQLSGGITPGATTPVTLHWTAGTTPGGTDLNANLTNATTTTPTFSAVGLAAGTYNVTFAATNPCGTLTVASTINVQPAPPPTINPIQNQTVTAGTPVTLTATSASTPSPTWTWAQVSGPANPILTQAPGAATPAASSSISFNPTVAGTYTFTVKATNANGSSPLTTVSVTATPTVPVNVTLANEYRIGKQRLIVTATSTDLTVASMRLLPYQTESGSIFDPASLGSNLTVSLVTPGSFTITLVGAPPPACNLGGTYATPCSKNPITVKSLNAAGTIIGSSPQSPMTKIRN